MDRISHLPALVCWGIPIQILMVAPNHRRRRHGVRRFFAFWQCSQFGSELGDLAVFSLRPWNFPNRANIYSRQKNYLCFSLKRVFEPRQNVSPLNILCTLRVRWYIERILFKNQTIIFIQILTIHYPRLILKISSKCQHYIHFEKLLIFVNNQFK